MKWTDSGSGEFLQPPVGTSSARCYSMIDLGTQKGEYQGQITHKRQVLIGWELSNELIPSGEKEGEPFVISKFYTASLHEKAALRHDLINWRGRDFSEKELQGFDPKNILGTPCMLTLVSNDKGRIKVNGVMKVMKGLEVPSLHNPIRYLSLEPEEFDRSVFEGLSEKIKAIIMESPEYKVLSTPPPPPVRREDVVDEIPHLTDDLDDVIPF